MYQPTRMVLGLLQEGLTWIGYLLATFFLFVIPGWALLSQLLPTWTQQDWVSKTALSTGVSLAIYPLLLLWTDVVGLHLGALYAWLPPLIGITAILWHNRNQIKAFSLKGTELTAIILARNNLGNYPGNDLCSPLLGNSNPGRADRERFTTPYDRCTIDP